MRGADKQVERIKKLLEKNYFPNLSLLQVSNNFSACIHCQVLIFIFGALAKVIPMPDGSIGKPFRRQCLKLQTLIHPVLLSAQYMYVLDQGGEILANQRDSAPN